LLQLSAPRHLFLFRTLFSGATSTSMHKHSGGEPGQAANGAFTIPCFLFLFSNKARMGVSKAEQSGKPRKRLATFFLTTTKYANVQKIYTQPSSSSPRLLPRSRRGMSRGRGRNGLSFSLSSYLEIEMCNLDVLVKNREILGWGCNWAGGHGPCFWDRDMLACWNLLTILPLGVGLGERRPRSMESIKEVEGSRWVEGLWDGIGKGKIAEGHYPVGRGRGKVLEISIMLNCEICACCLDSCPVT